MTRWFVLAAALAFSLSLGGCDKCGNFNFDLKSCQAAAPKS